MSKRNQTIPFQPAQLRGRHDDWTADRQIRVIEALAASACVEEACRSVGKSDTSAYALRLHPCGEPFRRAGTPRSTAATPSGTLNDSRTRKEGST